MKQSEKLLRLEKKIGYEFKNRDLLNMALTHKSFDKAKNNERLEFLGDAVVDLVVAEYLFNKFSKTDEGELSKLRASLVNEKGLAKLADLLGVGGCIFMSPSEENNGGRQKPSIISNAFEALIGAIYREAGLDKAKELTFSLLEEAHSRIDFESLFCDHKTTLQEFTQAHFGVVPDYRLVRSYGPDHKKEFEIAVYVGDKYLATANGKSKKEAQQEAAKSALEALKR